MASLTHKKCCYRGFKSCCLWPLLFSPLSFLHCIAHSYAFSLSSFPLAKYSILFHFFTHEERLLFICLHMNFLHFVFSFNISFKFNRCLLLSRYYIFIFYHNPEVFTKDMSSTIKIQKDSTVSFTFLKNDDIRHSCYFPQCLLLKKENLLF